MVDDTVTAAWVNHMVDAARELGYERPALLRSVGLEPSALDDLTAKVPLVAHDALYRKMARELGCDELEGASRFASMVASRFLPSGLGVAGIVMAASATILEAGEALDRLRGLMGPNYVAPTVRGDDKRVQITYPVPVDLGQHPERGQVSLLSAYLLNRTLVDPASKPLEVRFQHRRPPRLHWYEEKFPGAKLLFEQSATEIILPLSIHQRVLPLPVPDPNAYRIVRSLVLPRTVTDDSTAAKVRLILEDALDHAKYTSLSEDHAAKALMISTRTLSRRLHLEGTSLSRILDELRQERAKLYLSTTRYGIKAIAVMLGYSRHSAFTAAFVRWEEIPPSAYRQIARAAKP